MADYGIKILKPNAPSGHDVLNAPIKELIILSTAESHKEAFAGNVNYGVDVTHSLGLIPFCDAYYEDANGDLFPFGYIDDQVFDSLEMTITTSVLSAHKYNLKTYYSIFFE